MKRQSPPPTASLGFGITPKTEAPRSQTHADELPVARKARILVVDHDPALRRLMVNRLGAGYAVTTAEGALAALDACVLSRPNLVITDLRLKDMDGMGFLKELKSRWPQMSVIILTGHGTIAEAVQATQSGAFGYLVKPVGKEELLGQVERATADSSFTASDGDWRANLISRSRLMEDRLRIANRAAASGVPILLTGDNGTGKELFARAIHAASARREQPFVVVSCRTGNTDDLESELFGAGPDEAGCSEASREGALRRAHGGTLLLDEIGDLPVKMQVALAKELAKEQMPARAGGTAIRNDVRFICTTSRDIKPLTDNGAFFKDLYDQINILPIEIPPLGRRREDIPLLVSHFLEQATEPDGQKKIYSPKAIELLATTDWPGNVRQLFDLVKRNIALARGEVVTGELMDESSDGQSVKIPTYAEARDRFSREYLVQNLRRTSGNVAQAARLAKRSRTDFYNLLARYRLHPEDFKNEGSSRRRKVTNADEDEGGS